MFEDEKIIRQFVRISEDSNQNVDKVSNLWWFEHRFEQWTFWSSNSNQNVDKVSKKDKIAIFAFWD